MTPEGLMTILLERGVRLTRHGDELHVEAPAGALSEEERASLRSYKAELLRLLEEPAADPDPAADPALDDDRAFAAAWKGAARELGEIAGYPDLPFRAGHSVAPGAASWGKFVARASVPDLRLVVAVLRQRLQTIPRPEDDR